MKLVIFSIKKTSLSDKFFLDFSRQYKLWQDKEKEIEQSVKTIVFYVIFVIIEKDGIKNWRHKIMKKKKNSGNADGGSSFRRNAGRLWFR
ncbi:MAG: hypothetical protein ACLU9T_10275 [Blautia faecis]